MDGGSVDGTLKILENYSNHLTWRSEKDGGQTNAINKGFRLAQGEIVAYLNTDDVLLPDTFSKVATVFTNQPDTMWVTGQCYITDEDDNETRKLITLYKNLMLRLHNFPLLLMTNYISQPATFWRRNVLDSLGLLDESLNYVMDYEFWLRLYSNYRLHFIPSYLASFRIHPHSKTSAQGHKEEYISEERTIVRKYTDSKMLVFLHNFHRSIMTSAYKLMNHSN